MERYHDAPSALSPKRAQKSPHRNPLFAVFSMLLTIFLTFSLLVSIPFFALTHSISEDSLRELLSSISLTSLMDNAALMDELMRQAENNGVSPDDYDLTDASGLAQKLYSHLDANTLEDSNITPDTIQSVLEEDNVNAFLQEKMSACIDAVYHDDAPDVTISKDEIVQLVKDNEETIEEKTGLTLTEDDYEKLERAMDNMADGDELISLNALSLENSLPLAFLRKLMSPELRICVLLINLIAAVLLLLSNLFSIRRGIRNAGIAGCISGGIHTLLALLMRHVAASAVSGNAAYTLVLNIFNRFSSVFFAYAGIVLAAGILCLACTYLYLHCSQSTTRVASPS